MKLNDKKIVIRTNEKTFFIGSLDVLYCKAAGAYSVIYMINNEEIVTSINLSKLHERLNCLSSMVRICQSYIINLHYIKCVHHITKEVELNNKAMIPYTVPIKEIEAAIGLIS